jgi:hypothetical protein
MITRHLRASLAIVVDVLLPAAVGTVKFKATQAAKRRFGPSVVDYSTRASHSNGRFSSIPTDNQSRPGVLMVQRHHATTRHFDVRIKDEKYNRVIFDGAVTKEDLSSVLPSEIGHPTALIQQPEHAVSFFDSRVEGDCLEISPREYGAGLQWTVLKEPIEIHKTSPGEISFSLYTTDLAGRYKMMDQDGFWLVARASTWQPDQFGKTPLRKIGHDSREVPPEALAYEQRLKKQQIPYTVEEKIDGGQEILRLGEHRNELTSWRQSKRTGQAISHTDHFPGLRDHTSPEHAGLVLRGELVYVQGPVQPGVQFRPGGPQLPNAIAKLCNIRSPWSSRSELKEMGGTVAFVGWAVEDPHMTYEDQIQIMEGVAEQIPEFYVPRRWDSVEEAWNQIVLEENGEGIVIKPLDRPGPAVEGPSHWIKVKAYDWEDVEVVDWFPLSSDAKDPHRPEIGGLVVQRKNGATVEVGTGFSQAERHYLYDHREEIGSSELHIKMKFHAREMPSGSVHGPVFVGVKTDASEADPWGEMALYNAADSYGVESIYAVKNRRAA